MLKLGKRRQREDYSFGERQTNAKNIRVRARLHFEDARHKGGASLKARAARVLCTDNRDYSKSTG